MFLYTEKLGPWGGELAPWTITWSCVFLDHNLKLSPNRALRKWCFPKVATLRWRLLLRPQYCLSRCPYFKSTVVTPNWVYRSYCTGRALQLIFRIDFASKSAIIPVSLYPAAETVLSHIVAIFRRLTLLRRFASPSTAER